ncbi:MAG TPA: tripartite tricarboxylate transporter substrate binding protein [Xanthobacteraceae bacterium]|nr:tripartite tricarboxylate transporter substrate binding protein [Xanthobacteraceae bacterium]
MRIARREFLQVAAAVTACASSAARAQAYPTRPVRIIVGFAAGGTADIVARVIAQWLSQRLGQPFLVENRTGGSGNLATAEVVRAPGDGYTLLLAPPATAANTTLYDHLNFDFLRDTAPVAGIMRVPGVMEVHPSFPARTVPEFISYAKLNPGKINMASAGSGTPQHVGGELFKLLTGVEMVHVPYRGNAPALADLLAGEVQVMFDTMPNSIAYIRAGKLRPLAVTTAMRWDGLPELPTVGDFVPGYEASGWYGLVAPKSTPDGIIARLNNEVDAALADAKMRARLAEMGGTTLGGPPEDFGRLLASETEKWGRVIRAAHIKAE